MSQTDFFNDQATVLRTPSWLGRDVYEDRELPLAPGDYKITPGERWTVTSPKPTRSSTTESGRSKFLKISTRPDRDGRAVTHCPLRAGFFMVAHLGSSEPRQPTAQSPDKFRDRGRHLERVHDAPHCTVGNAATMLPRESLPPSMRATKCSALTLRPIGWRQ